MTREHFLSNLSHWNSYLSLLWEALENTSGDIIELGMGDGSTEKLHDYTLTSGRKLFSYDSDMFWYRKFERFNTDFHRVEYVGKNWEVLYEKHCGKQMGVLFSDEAPGEMRKYNVSMFAQSAQVIICHDAEKTNDHGYRFSWVKPLFKYYKLHEFPGASTAAFSNFIDVSKWVI